MGKGSCCKGLREDRRSRRASFWLLGAFLAFVTLGALGLGQVAGSAQAPRSAGEKAEPGAVQGPALDLNTASATDLKTLPGMGDAYVRRVIEGRPYTAKNQLVTRGVLPKEAYERIRDRVVAHRPRL